MFKVGEKVKIVRNNFPGEWDSRDKQVPVGTVGTIRRISSCGYSSYGGGTWYSINGWDFSEKEIERVCKGMTKSDLRNGDVIVHKTGQVGVIILGKFEKRMSENLAILYPKTGGWNSDYMTDDFGWKGCDPNRDKIIKIYRPKHPVYLTKLFQTSEIEKEKYDLIFDAEKDGKAKELEELVGKLQGQLTDAQSELRKIKG